MHHESPTSKTTIISNIDNNIIINILKVYGYSVVTRGYSFKTTLKSLNVFVVTRVYMLVNMFQVPFWRL